MLVTPCDEYFPCIHFDEPQVSMNVSATPIQLAHMFFPDTISTSPIAPTNDDESLRSPQAAQWEAARQEEIHSCHANSVSPAPMPLPRGNQLGIYTCTETSW